MEINNYPGEFFSFGLSERSDEEFSNYCGYITIGNMSFLPVCPSAMIVTLPNSNILNSQLSIVPAFFDDLCMCINQQILPLTNHNPPPILSNICMISFYYGLLLPPFIFITSLLGVHYYEYPLELAWLS